MNWISTSKNEPKYSGTYIINTPNGIGFADYNPLTGFKNIILTGLIQHSSQMITHWMPLPKSPLGYIEINAETRFDQSIEGTWTSLTLLEMDAINRGENIFEIAPDWEERPITGLHPPREKSMGRGYNGNDMGFDYLYRYKNGNLSEELPKTNSDI